MTAGVSTTRIASGGCGIRLCRLLLTRIGHIDLAILYTAILYTAIFLAASFSFSIGHRCSVRTCSRRRSIALAWAVLGFHISASAITVGDRLARLRRCSSRFGRRLLGRWWRDKQRLCTGADYRAVSRLSHDVDEVDTAAMCEVMDASHAQSQRRHTCPHQQTHPRLQEQHGGHMAATQCAKPSSAGLAIHVRVGLPPTWNLLA